MNWPLGRVSDIAVVISGFAFKSTWFGEGDSKVVRIGDLQDRRINLENAKVFDSSLHDVKDQFKIKSGDILMALSGATVGKVAIAQKKDEGTYLNQRVAIIRGKSTDNTGYLRHAFSGVALKKLLLNAGGAAQPNLSPKDLAEMEIILPPLPEQKRIADILDKADGISRKRQQAIDLADEFLRATFLDMFGDPVSNPKDWPVKNLSNLSDKILNGTTPSGGSKVYVSQGVNFLRSQNVWKNNIIFDDSVYLDEATHKLMAKSSLMYKDILMTKTGRINTENSSLGRAALFLGEDGSANINGHVYLIRLKKTILHEFVVFILTTREYRDYIRNVCVGGIDKRQINKDHLEDFPIIFPNVELQEKFVNQIQKVNIMRVAARSFKNKADKMFESLSQRAFTGGL